jgi:ComF family protein
MCFPVLKDFLSLVFPQTCSICKRSLFEFEQQLCKICLAKLPFTNHHLFPKDNDLTMKTLGLTTADHVVSMLRFSKKGMSQQLLHQLKYKNRPQIGIELGMIYGNMLSTLFESRQWTQIIPVPLHPVKQKRRGYNQSEQFGIGISRSLEIPVYNTLRRITFTETQTKKSRLQRMENVSEVFDLNTQTVVKGERILLVDDVMTTGATLITCANLLVRHQAEYVDMAVIAAGKF